MSSHARTLAVRLDSDGDVLLTGPALRALAARTERLDVLVSPAGAAAAHLLPGVGDVLVFDPPWSGHTPAPVDTAAVNALVMRLADRGYDHCVIFTSFHQSPLPVALLARMAGIGSIAATSEDYPGSLLDVRHRRPDGMHEVEAALDLACAADGALPDGDAGLLRLRDELPSVDHLPLPSAPYVVLHPGATVPARAMDPEHARSLAGALSDAGWPVVVTGGPAERSLCAVVAGAHHGVLDLSGRTSLAELATVLSGAACVVVGNTGPAHLAAAVGTPVVSLFSPVVPAGRWAPYGVPVMVLGDQQAPCRDTRARDCPVPGHPCLSTVPALEVVESVRVLARHSAAPGSDHATDQVIDHATHHATDRPEVRA